MDAPAGEFPAPLDGSVSAADEPDWPPATVSLVVLSNSLDVVAIDWAETICSFWVRVDSAGSLASSRVTSTPVSRGAPAVSAVTVIPEGEVPASL